MLELNDNITIAKTQKFPGVIRYEFYIEGKGRPIFTISEETFETIFKTLKD